VNSFDALVLSEMAAYVLAVARVAGFVVTSPFPGRNVPNRAKIGLVLMLAWVARSIQPAKVGLGLDFALFGLVPGELGLGIVMGFTVRIAFSAAELLGLAFAQGTSLTLGSVFDPALGTDDPVPARLVTLFSMLLFFAVGAHRVALAYALESFRALPIAHATAIGAASPTIVDFVARATEAGVRLALPVVAVGLAVQIALALISRASPSLQIFSVGMGLSVAAGMLTILGCINDSSAGLAREFEVVGVNIERIVSAVAGR
jgi:flagellar biosynthetic protein FliR